MNQKIECPSVERLESLLSGKLVEPELRDLSHHLESCLECQARAKTFVSQDTLVDALKGEVKPADAIGQKMPAPLLEKIKKVGQAPAVSGDTIGFSQDGLAAQDAEINFLSPPQQPDEMGRLGQYRILSVLGKGGMGAVFLAEDPKLDRKVALKVMLPKIAANPSAKDRFLREARAAAKLKSDHIIHIYQVDEANGVPFLAMELLEGQPLDQMLHSGKKLTVPQIMKLGKEIAKGLSTAHEKGLIHRDIKPGNIWLDSHNAGRAKILDFGLARNDKDDVNITQSGAIVGTPAYMAPEQARGEKNVDARADLFSLGVLLYRICTGDIPFKSETTMGTLMAIALNNPTPPSKINEAIPQALSETIMQLLEKEPTKRPASAKELIARLIEIEKKFSPSAGLRYSETQGSAANLTFSQKPISSSPNDPLGSENLTQGLEKPALSETVELAKKSAAQPPKKRRPLIALASGFFLGFIALLAGIVYVVTDNGTIQIDPKDKDIQIIVKQNGEQVDLLDSKTKKVWTLKTGTYTLHLNEKDEKDGYEIDLPKDKPFVLKRGGVEVVTIRKIPGQLASGKELGNEMPPISQSDSNPFALEFDGKSSFVDLPQLKWERSQGFTVEAWTWLDTVESSPQPLIASQHADFRIFMTPKSSARPGWLFTYRPHEKGITVVSPDPVPQGRWTHVAGVYDGQLLRLFLDGRESAKAETTSRSKGIWLASARLGNFPPSMAGVDLESDKFFKGRIKAVRISKAVRYEKAFTPAGRFESDTNTLALYRFDEGQGDVLKDSSGNGHHGKIVGAKWVKADGTAIVAHGYALQFDGNNEVEVKSLKLNKTGPLTMEAYVTPRRLEKVPFNFIVGAKYSFALQIRDGAKWQFGLRHTHGGYSHAGETAVALDQSAHVAVVRRGIDYRLYLNGTMVASKELPDPLAETSEPFRIGQLFNGEISEVRISKVARYDKNFTPQKRFEPDADTLALYHMDEGSGDKLTDSSGNGHHGKIIGAKWVKTDGSPIPTGPMDADRIAATRALELGASLVAINNNYYGGIRTVADLPKTPFELTHLGFFNNRKITDADLTIFQDCKGLKTLGLEACPKVTDAGLAHFRNCKNLVHLAVLNTPITDAGLAHFKDCKLTDLRVAGSAVTDAGLAYFKDCQLKALWAGHLPITDDVLQRFTALQELGLLKLEQTKVTDAGLAQFKDSKKINDLNLSSTAVTDAGLLHLANCKDMYMVSLSDTGIKDAGLAMFKGCSRVWQLNLNDTNVSDAGLVHLKDCGGFIGLNLGLEGTRVTGAGLAHLRAGKLHSINLNKTGVTDESLEHLKKQVELQHVRMRKTKVTAEGVRALSLALPKCKIEWDGGVIEPTAVADPDRKAAEYVLSIGGTIPVLVNEHSRSINGVAELPKENFLVTGVLLGHNQKVSDAGLAHFKDCKNLTTLYLVHTQVSDAGLAHFQNCKNLTNLGLYNTQVSDAGLAYFKDCKHLVALNLGKTQVSDAGLAHFQNCKNLTDLGLGITQVSDAGLAHFKDCKNLTILSLVDTLVSDAGLAHFKDCKSLTILDLARTQVSDAGLAHFKDCKNLGRLHLGGTKVSDAGLAHLKDCKNLTYLDVQKTKVTAKALADFHAALPNCRIEHDGGVIEPKVVIDADRKAAEFVLANGGGIWINGEHNYNLQYRKTMPDGEFKLTGFSLVDNAAKPKLKAEVFRVFAGCKHLRDIGLHSTPVGDEGIAHFQNSPNIRRLSLHGTGITDKGLAQFQKRKDLIQLFLYEPKLTEDGILGFAGQTELEYLDLWGKFITDRSCAAFSGCTKLKNLGLTCDGLSDEGLLNFKNALEIENLGFGLKSSDKAVGHFLGLKSLKKLGFGGGSYLKPEAFAGVEAGPLLNVIDLSTSPKMSAETTDALLAACRKCRLQVLDLRMTGVTSAGFAQLRPNLGRLANLQISETTLGTESVGLLKECVSLHTLDIRKTKFTEADVKELAKALPQCKIIHDGGTSEPYYTPEDLKAVESALKLGGKVGVEAFGPGVADMASLPKPARSLRVAFAGIKGIVDADLAPLTKTRNVQIVHLNNPGVTDAGLLHFKGLPLHRFEAVGMPQLTDAGLAHLTDCRWLTHLVVTKAAITDDTLAKAANWPDLELLVLQGTAITDKGVAGLKDCPRLTHLNLTETKISDAGLDVLRGHKPILQLFLSYTAITDVGLAKLAGCTNLVQLEVRKTKVTEKGVKELAAKLPNCEINWDGGVIEPKVVADADRKAAEWVLSIGGKVSLKGQEQEVDAVDALPRENFLLTRVNLAGTRANDVGLVHFKDCKNLGILSLFGTKVTDTGLAHLKDCKGLGFLNLGDTKVTDTGLSHLKGNKGLTYLNLGNTMLTDSGLAHFKDCKGLIFLDVKKTAVTAKGLEAFLNAVPGCRIEWDGGVIEPVSPIELAKPFLAELLKAGVLVDVANQTGDRFRKILSVQDLASDDRVVTLRIDAKAAENPKSLELLWRFPSEIWSERVAGRALHVHGKISEERFRAILAIPTLHTVGQLYFQGMETPLTDAAFADLGRFTDVAHLYMPSKSVSDDVLKAISAMPRVGVLGLAGTKITGSGIALLRGRSLVHLELQYCEGVNDVALEHLAAIRALESLHLNRTKITDAGLPKLSALTKLKGLNVNETKVTEAGVKKLAEALPGCRIVWQGGVIAPKVAVDADRKAAEWVLSIGGEVGTFEKGKDRILRRPDEIPKSPFQIGSIGLGSNRNITDDGLKHLAGLAALRFVFLSDTRITDEAVVHLRSLPKLEQLDLASTPITDAGLAKLGDAPMLGSINLQSTKITNDCARTLLGFKSLTALDIAHTAITDAGLTSLSQSKQIVSLYAHATKITDEGIQAIAAMRQLGALNVGHTGITDKSLDVIAELPELMHLSLAETKITDAGASKLTKLTKLRTLDLRETAIRSGMVAKLHAALPGCRIYHDGGVIEPQITVGKQPPR